MSADILIESEEFNILDDSQYQKNLLNQNLRSRMRLNRSKYEVLTLKDYFENREIKDMVQAYINSNLVFYIRCYCRYLFFH